MPEPDIVCLLLKTAMATDLLLLLKKTMMTHHSWLQFLHHRYLLKPMRRLRHGSFSVFAFASSQSHASTS